MDGREMDKQREVSIWVEKSTRERKRKTRERPLDSPGRSASLRAFSSLTSRIADEMRLLPTGIDRKRSKTGENRLNCMMCLW